MLFLTNLPLAGAALAPTLVVNDHTHACKVYEPGPTIQPPRGWRIVPFEDFNHPKESCESLGYRFEMPFLTGETTPYYLAWKWAMGMFDLAVMVFTLRKICQSLQTKRKRMAIIDFLTLTLCGIGLLTLLLILAILVWTIINPCFLAMC